MAKYFNTLTGVLSDSTDGVPQVQEVTELSDLEYAVMQLRMHHTFDEIFDALSTADDLCNKVGV